MKTALLPTFLMLVAAAIPARAGSILCPACIPTLDVYVNNSFLATLAGTTSNGGATFTISALLGSPGQFSITVLAVTNPDPFVDYGLTVSNFSTSSTSFSFQFSSPTVGGPFGSTTTQLGATVTDLGDDGASLIGNPPVSSLQENGEEPGLAYTYIGGNLIGKVGSGCNAASGSTQNCGTDQSGFNHGPFSGILSVQLNFTLGPTDQVTFFNSRSEITEGNAIPEPAAWMTAAGGLAFLLWRRRRRAHRDAAQED